MARRLQAIVHGRHWDAVVALEMPVARYALQLRHTVRILDLNVSASYQRYLYSSQLQGQLERAHAWVGWQKVQRYERRLCRHFACCTVVLEPEAAYLRDSLAGARCEVLISENGVDLVRNQPNGTSSLANSLIYTGALTYEANLDAVAYFLAEIYPHIRQKQPAARLVVTGSTRGVDTGRLALDASVHLSGYIPDIRPAIRRSAVCVIPLRKGTGTRLKILEAMALGTPIVTTSKGAEGLAVRHGEHVLIADDPAAFASCTLQLLEDRALAARLAANGRRLVEERYDWSAIGRHFVTLVEQAAARPC
jgi:glycosyltransferase involved in cell wall biosynthesis